LSEAGILSPDLHWQAGSSQLWFVGDLVDRGPEGTKVIALLMRLQQEAQAVGGVVESLLGNHDISLLAAYKIPTAMTTLGLNFYDDWLRYGTPNDLATLTPVQAQWLATRPFMALVNQHLLFHADGPLYLDYGHTITQVNTQIAELLAGEDPVVWDTLLEGFNVHHWFEENPEGIRQLLTVYGGQRIVHGHTPIYKQLCQPPEYSINIEEAWVYAENTCVNVDGSLYNNCPGFLYILPDLAI
jgi:hypothetical protein